MYLPSQHHPMVESFCHRFDSATGRYPSNSCSGCSQNLEGPILSVNWVDRRWLLSNDLGSEAMLPKRKKNQKEKIVSLWFNQEKSHTIAYKPTMLAEYDVNMASMARNVVIMMNRPDNVCTTKCVPCWQTAPITNETTSNHVIFPRTAGCTNCENIITVITMVISIQHAHTSELCKKSNTARMTIFILRVRFYRIGMLLWQLSRHILNNTNNAMFVCYQRQNENIRNGWQWRLAKNYRRSGEISSVKSVREKEKQTNKHENIVQTHEFK